MEKRENTLNGVGEIRKYLAGISNSEHAHVVNRRAARMRERHVNVAISLLVGDEVVGEPEVVLKKKGGKNPLSKVKSKPAN